MKWKPTAAGFSRKRTSRQRKDTSRRNNMQEQPEGVKITENKTRYRFNERLYIDKDRRPVEGENFLFGVFRPTGVTIALGAGEVGEVVNYLGGAYTLEEALIIAQEAEAQQRHQEQFLLF